MLPYSEGIMANQRFISVSVTEQQMEEYTIAAKLMGKNRSQMIRDAISEYMASRKKEPSGYKGRHAHNKHAVYAQVVNDTDLAVVDYYTPRQNFLKPGWYLAIRKDGAIRNVQGERLDYVHYFGDDITVKPSYTEFVKAVMAYVLEECN